MKTPPFDYPLYAPAAEVAAVLRGLDNVVITAHTMPDGDAMGSMYALGFALKHMGKKVAVCNESGLSDYWMWMSGPTPVFTSLRELDFIPQNLVVLDCGALHRIGEHLMVEVQHLPSVCVDHHLGTQPFGTLGNWVESRMAATGQMVAAIIHALGVPMNKDIAEAVYVAINSDSGSFSFDNVTPELFLLASWLMHQGCDVAEARRRLDNQWSLTRMRLWGRLLHLFTLHGQNRIALCQVPLTLLHEFNATKEDLEGFVEHLRRLKTVEVAAMVREDAPCQCKASLRSSGPVDVRLMAQEFGGGGHRNAAGATVRMPLSEATQSVLQVVARHLGCTL